MKINIYFTVNEELLTKYSNWISVSAYFIFDPIRQGGGGKIRPPKVNCNYELGCILEPLTDILIYSRMRSEKISFFQMIIYNRWQQINLRAWSLQTDNPLCIFRQKLNIHFLKIMVFPILVLYGALGEEKTNKHGRITNMLPPKHQGDKMQELVTGFSGFFRGEWLAKNNKYICTMNANIHTITTQMVDTYLLSFYLLASYQPFTSS